MSLIQLRASRALWRRREVYREKKHLFFHNDSRRSSKERIALTKKWHELYQEAHAQRIKRDRQIISKQRKNRKAAAKTTGVGRYDGVPVAAWLIPYLQWARNHGWKGRLVSGWRDPKYSQSLCYRMCGRPSCPGKCAGLNSNHVGSVKPRGAIDVSEYAHFAQLMRECPLQPRIFNALGARDPVHFSVSGS